MKVKKKSGCKNPTVNLAVNKSRIKKYGEKKSISSYYLEKGQEFQIELYNPTQGKVLTTINLNNKAISGGGLVLRPGERVFLDRFLESNKKFLFDTYNVDNIKSAVKAIKDNGDLEVAFFKEISLQPIICGSTSSGTANLDLFSHTTNNAGNYNLSNTSQDFYIPCRSDSAGNSIGITTSAGVGTTTPTNSFDVTSVASASSDITLDIKGTLKGKIKKSKIGLEHMRSAVAQPTIETGRIEEGSVSNQKLKSTTGDFEMQSFHVIRYKLLPKSQKLSSTVEYFSKYCVDCGGRCKSKFCPFCGKKQ